MVALESSVDAANGRTMRHTSRCCLKKWRLEGTKQNRSRRRNFTDIGSIMLIRMILFVFHDDYHIITSIEQYVTMHYGQLIW